MNKLISADLPRVLKSKMFFIVLILTVVMAVASVLTTFVESDQSEIIFLTSSCNLILFTGMMLPVFTGGLSVMVIAVEFSSGIIRNKFVMGHSRKNILCAWTLIYSFTTLITFIVYVAAFFITLGVTGVDLSSFDGSVIATNLLLVFCFWLKFQMFSLLMICIYPDAKTAVIVYLLNNCTMVPIILASMSDTQSTAMKVLSRFFIHGYTAAEGFSLAYEYDKPWLTAVCAIGLGVVYWLLARYYFEKKDLK